MERICRKTCEFCSEDDPSDIIPPPEPLGGAEACTDNKNERQKKAYMHVFLKDYFRFSYGASDQLFFDDPSFLQCNTRWIYAKSSIGIYIYAKSVDGKTNFLTKLTNVTKN